MADVQLSTLGSVIKTAYEGQSDTNAYTDAEQSKLAAIEASATADQTGAEIEGLLDTTLANVRWKEVEVPSGGSTGQVLKKTSGTDYDYAWAADSGSGGGLTIVADLTALAAIAEGTISDGDTAMVADSNVIYVYDSVEVDGVLPADDSDGIGSWVPVVSKAVDLASTVHLGTLSVDYLGGDSGAGDANKYLNEVGTFTQPTGNVSVTSADPASAPGSSGAFAANTVGRHLHVSLGVAATSDWVRIITEEDAQVPADLPTAAITTTDLLAFGDTSNADASAATTIANFVADLDIVTETGTQTLTNKTLTNPKASYSPFAAGTKSSGTYTLAYSDGNTQAATNGGAHTLAPQTGDGVIYVHYTNNSTAGAITTTGYTVVKGDSLTTTDTQEFILVSVVVNSVPILNVIALQ